MADTIQTTVDPTKHGLVVVNPDGSSIGGGEGGAGVSAYSDSGNTDKKGLVDADRHVQVDVLTMPVGSSGLTDSELRATPVPVSGTVTANLSATDNAVLDQIELNQLPDGHNVTVDNASLAVTGTFWQATQPVSGTVAVTNAGITTIAGAVAGSEMQVDVLTMPTVAVTQSGTWDEVGINDSGNSITIDNPQLSVVGGGTEAAAQRVTIANDSTGVLSVDDNGGSLTVDGTVAVTGTFWQATQPVSLASVPSHAVTNAGTFSVQTSAVVTGTGATNLGKAEDAAHTTGDVGVMVFGVRNDGAATSFSGTNGDYTPIGVDATGTVSVHQKASTATLSNIASSASSVTLLSANTSRKGATIVNDSSALLYIKFGTTASSTSYTVVLAGASAAPFTYYEIPGGYTGRIDGIWASATGNARVTEIT